MKVKISFKSGKQVAMQINSFQDFRAFANHFFQSGVQVYDNCAFQVKQVEMLEEIKEDNE